MRESLTRAELADSTGASSSSTTSSSAPEITPEITPVELLESRFGGEFLAFAVPRSHQTRVAGVLLRLLAQSKQLAGTGASGVGGDNQLADESEMDKLTPQARAERLLVLELDASAGLIEILPDGTPVRRVLAGTRAEKPTLGASEAMVMLLAFGAVLGGMQVLYRSEEARAELKRLSVETARQTMRRLGCAAAASRVGGSSKSDEAREGLTAADEEDHGEYGEDVEDDDIDIDAERRYSR